MRGKIWRRAGAVLLAGVLGVSAARAHVTLEQPVAEAGRYFSARFMVPHGCQGSPVVRVRVRIPDGITGITPMVHAGWSLSVQKTKPDTPYQAHGVLVTERVAEVTWEGGRLPDQFLDIFVIRMKLPDRPDTTLYFPTITDCETGSDHWIEIPRAGQKWLDLKEPAPFLRLVPATSPDPQSFAQ